MGIFCVTQELSLVLCDSLEGWEMERGVGGGTDVSPQLIHIDEWQMPVQYCKAIILQLKQLKIFYLDKNATF